MYPWTVTGVPYFNLLMLCVDAAGLYYLFRTRTAAGWWKAALFAACASFLLFCLFVFGPWFVVRFNLATLRQFAVHRLACYVIFLHGTICLAGGAILLYKKARKTALLSAFGAVGLLVVAIDAFWIEPTWLDVTHLRIESPKLTRPVRVVVLADIQTEAPGAHERRVLARVMAEKPDLILFAGDYVQAWGNGDGEVADKLGQLMKDARLAAPEGLFAVQGNVDRWRPWLRAFDGLPVVPVTSTSSFEVAGLQLTCLSMGDSFTRRLRLRRPKPGTFHLVLGHSPDFALGQVDADLLVAGHTHGGQVRLPWIGALSSGCGVPRAWAAGVTPLPGGAKLIVSRGLGMEGGHAPRLRFFCRPELLVIDLVPQPPDGEKDDPKWPGGPRQEQRPEPGASG